MNKRIHISLFSRYSTRHDTVTIEPIYENGTTCSQKALLSTQSTQATKLSSVVIAEELGRWIKRNKIRKE